MLGNKERDVQSNESMAVVSGTSTISVIDIYLVDSERSVGQRKGASRS